MDIILNGFHNEISELKNLLRFYETENKLLDSYNSTPSTKEEKIVFEISEMLKAFRLSKLQFNYNSFIISLYGSFERFIENSLISYVDKLNQLTKVYSELPDTILKNHFILSLSLINKIDQPKYSGPLRKQEIIKNLHTCINTHDAFELNKEAFAQHTANFRFQVIEESFSNIGIIKLGQKILKIEEFNSYCIEKLGLNDDAELIPSESFQILNDLAEYRNYVAHGISSEIIKNDILIDYLTFFHFFSIALIKVIQDNLLFRDLEINGIELGEITDLYQDGNIVCFKTNNNSIKKGDVLIGTNKELIVKALIITIQLDGKEIEFVDDKSDYEIGVKIDSIFKKTFKIFRLKKNL